MASAKAAVAWALKNYPSLRYGNGPPYDNTTRYGPIYFDCSSFVGHAFYVYGGFTHMTEHYPTSGSYTSVFKWYEDRGECKQYTGAAAQAAMRNPQIGDIVFKTPSDTGREMGHVAMVYDKSGHIVEALGHRPNMTASRHVLQGGFTRLIRFQNFPCPVSFK